MVKFFGLLVISASALIAPRRCVRSVARTRLRGTYRIYNVAVDFEADPGASVSASEVSSGLVAAARQQVKRLESGPRERPKKKTTKKGRHKRPRLKSVVRVVRKSLDARRRAGNG